MVFTWTSVGPKLVAGSETHWYLPGVVSLENAIIPAIVMANKRVELLAGNCSLLMIRMSDDAVRGDSARVLPDNQPHGQMALMSSSTIPKTITCDQPNSVVLVRGRNTATTKKNLFLMGIPDQVIRTQPAGPDLDVVNTWRQRWNTFRDHMIGALAGIGGALAPLWGFRARSLSDETGRKEIVNWTQSAGAPPNLILHIPTGQLNVAVGKLLQVRNVKMLIPGTPRPTGMWRVHAKTVSAGNDLFELRSTSGYDAAAIDEPGTAEPVTYSYFPYTSLTTEGQTTRKRGVSSAAARGKSSRRTRRLV